MNRKSFILTLAAGFASLFVSLPRKKYVLYGDGIHDDTEALQAWFNGDYEDVCYPDGSPVGKTLSYGTYFITGSIWPKDSFFGPNANGQAFDHNYIQNGIPQIDEGLFHGHL